ncbi:hypothetical protein GY45DRAFT_1326959 [Cubamyces sp. BRFM 1775]|nr:hypothetical protein GY45DRAFT_1326959 [Cubamyces sp. BRFM 1775]
MPRSNTKSKSSVSMENRRMTRSMTKSIVPAEPVLVDVVNTVNNIHNENAPLIPPPLEEPQQVLQTETVRDDKAVGVPDSEAPCICATFKKGDKVEVYMRTHGEWGWRAGKVANTSQFRPRLTKTGSRAYPVLLEQRRPRIIQWFDPGLTRRVIRHSNSGSCCSVETSVR